ncbi:MAG TPA: hypothetical protein VK638_19390 [Edaphobacter sp.]|nr:hypothetical protein [Edaphobacter sp.]
MRDIGADLTLDANGKKYIVQLKVSSEGRRDRLIPLLSQAILQARELAEHSPEPAAPLAVVAAKHIPPSVAEHIKQFAARYAPEVGVGIIDAEGFRSFNGVNLEGFDSKPTRRVAYPPRVRDLFSDLNQWMLKILLGQHLPEPLISVPRMPLRSATQLASAADVSVMSASRLLNQLAERNFLDENRERLQIVRVEELLELWISANRQTADDIPARWILKQGPHQLQSALREYTSPHDSGSTASKGLTRRHAIKILPRCCLGLFSAADALGFGFVHGAPPHIYLERLTLDSLNRLNLVIDHSSRAADVYLRIPANREAIFRASVVREGVPASDILQVWLDVSTHPARGREQAREIWQHVLKSLSGRRG